MPFDQFLLPLIGGYWFIHRTYYLRYRAHTLSSYRLILESATAGAVLLFVAQVLAFGYENILIFSYPWTGFVRDLWALVVPFGYVGTGSVALVLGFAGAAVTNRIWPRKFSAGETIRSHGTDLLQLFYEAANGERLVMISLENRKVYVGKVVLSVNLRHDNPYVVILPMQSGYRATEDLRVHFTTDYTRVYAGIQDKDPSFAHLKSRDFVVVLPLGSIVSATPFGQQIPTDFSLPAVANVKTQSPGRRKQ